MGTDKAFVGVDGVAMVRRVVRALEDGGAREVVCIGGDHPRLRALGLRSIDDERPGDGPLAGLITGLGWCNEPMLVVAGCDQPWLSATTISDLVRTHACSHSPITVYRAGGRLQPFPGVYDTAIRGVLTEAFADGVRALHGALSLVARTVIDAAEPALLRDVDQPADLGPA